MCTHKPYRTLPPLATAVQGGAALHPPIEGALPDIGEGGSISHKNPAYCELTVQYYAWKNVEADCYGFCHYRRFFGKRSSVPYRAVGRLTQRQRDKLLLSEEELLARMRRYDVLVPRAEDMGVSVWEQYASSPHCFGEDLERFTVLLKQRYPHLASAADSYLSQSKQYFCNMFIMCRELFFDYCSHLFPLLEEFDLQKTVRGDFQSDRTDGYLAERFFGIYLFYLRENGKKIWECTRIDAESTCSKRILCALAPPESRRRHLLKKLKSPSNKKS